jgi:hypothetical protein
MKATLGETGTEQFTLEIEFTGHKFPAQQLHDPFIRTRIGISRWDLFKALFRKQFEVRIRMDGTEAVIRAIMTLDPEQLKRETEEIQECRRLSRESSATIGYCTESAAKGQ